MTPPNGANFTPKELTLLLIKEQQDEIKWLRRLVWIAFIVGIGGYGLAGAAKLRLI